jgi:hypothetical protein
MRQDLGAPCADVDPGIVQLWKSRNLLRQRQR